MDLFRFIRWVKDILIDDGLDAGGSGSLGDGGLDAPACDVAAEGSVWVGEEPIIADGGGDASRPPPGLTKGDGLTIEDGLLIGIGIFYSHMFTSKHFSAR